MSTDRKEKNRINNCQWLNGHKNIGDSNPNNNNYNIDNRQQKQQQRQTTDEKKEKNNQKKLFQRKEGRKHETSKP